MKGQLAAVVCHEMMSLLSMREGSHHLGGGRETLPVQVCTPPCMCFETRGWRVVRDISHVCEHHGPFNYCLVVGIRPFRLMTYRTCAYHLEAAGSSHCSSL